MPNHVSKINVIEICHPSTKSLKKFNEKHDNCFSGSSKMISPIDPAPAARPLHAKTVNTKPASQHERQMVHRYESKSRVSEAIFQFN